ncbi:MAG: DUF2884 family protein [Burkholderiales bacterium]|nr:MAG: DUF2884 family protein [Burkholderiales bacterium]
MKVLKSALVALALSALLCACGPQTNVSTDSGHVISDGKRVTLRADGQPEAQISAAGEFSVDGKPVSVTSAQRDLLQTYHRELNGMTADGIAIGAQGAALAGKAVTEAIKGAINGDGDQIDARIEAEAKKIEQQALQLCKRLVTIKAAQDSLATQLPAFKPYATIDVQDVDDCDSDQSDSYAAGKEVGGSLARAVKGEKDHGTDGNAGNAAARADAAATAAEQDEARR